MYNFLYENLLIFIVIAIITCIISYFIVKKEKTHLILLIDLGTVFFAYIVFKFMQLWISDFIVEKYYTEWIYFIFLCVLLYFISRVVIILKFNKIRLKLKWLVSFSVILMILRRLVKCLILVLVVVVHQLQLLTFVNIRQIEIQVSIVDCKNLVYGEIHLKGLTNWCKLIIHMGNPW